MEGDLSENTYIFVMIDLDNSKRQRYHGHNNGDECLKELAES
jgi:GGDEF domain-containing protein